MSTANINLKIIVLLLCLLSFLLPVYATELSDIELNFATIKQNLLFINIRYKPYLSTDDELTKEIYKDANSWIRDKYKDIISGLQFADLSVFIKNTYILVKYYDFKLLDFSKEVKEKLLYLEVNSSKNVQPFITDFDAIVSDKYVPSYKSWDWSPPAVEEQARIALNERRYEDAIRLSNQAIKEWHEIVIPPDATDEEIDRFLHSRTYFTADDYYIIASSYFYLNKYETARTAAHKSINLFDEIDEEITYTWGSYVVIVRSDLWGHLNAEQEGLKIATEAKAKIFALPDSSWAKPYATAECYLLLSEAYRCNQDLKQALEFGESAKNKFSSVFSNNQNAREVATARCETQLALSSTGEQANKYFASAATKFRKWFPNDDILFFQTYEMVKEHRKILYPHVKSISIDRELTPVFVEPETPIKIYFDYTFPFNNKPNTRIAFFSYKIKLEIYQGDSDSNPVYTDTIDIAGASTESVKLSFTWPGFDKGSAKEGETFTAKVTSVAKELHTGKERVTAGDTNSLYFGIPLVIDEKNSTLVFPIKEAEVTACKIAYFIQLPVFLKGNYNLELEIKNESEELVYSNILNNVQDGAGAFLWSVCSKIELPIKNDCTPLSPGNYFVRLILKSNEIPAKKDIYAAESLFSGLYIDLDIIPYNNELTDETPLDESVEETEGVIIDENIDDDDGDCCNISTFDPIPDKYDIDGVDGEDDLVRLKLHKIFSNSSMPSNFSKSTFIGKLIFSEEHIKIWRDSRKTVNVSSQTTVFDPTIDNIVYVEGINSNPLNTGDIITLEIIRTDIKFNAFNAGLVDNIKTMVPQEKILVFWAAGSNDVIKKEFKKYLESITKPANINKNRCQIYGLNNQSQKVQYSIYFDSRYPQLNEERSQELFSLALSKIDAHVIYNGHSNFGLGFIFYFNSPGTTSIEKMFNVGYNMAAIEWKYLIKYLNNDFKVLKTEYADDNTLPQNGLPDYNPWKYTDSYKGATHSSIITQNEYFYSRYSAKSTGSNPHQLTLHVPDPNDPSSDFHIDLGDDSNLLIVNQSKSLDLPKLGYKTLFINGCKSGHYFRDFFNNGVFMYTTEFTENSVINFVKAYVEKLINGGSVEETWATLYKMEPIFDYQINN